MSTKHCERPVIGSPVGCQNHKTDLSQLLAPVRSDLSSIKGKFYALAGQKW